MKSENIKSVDIICGWSHSHASESSSSSQRISSSAKGGALTETQFSQKMSQSSSSKKSSSVTMASSNTPGIGNFCQKAALFNSSLMDQAMKIILPIEELNNSFNHFGDLASLKFDTGTKQVENTLVKYCSVMNNSVQVMKKDGSNAESLCQWMTKGMN